MKSRLRTICICTPWILWVLLQVFLVLISLSKESLPLHWYKYIFYILYPHNYFIPTSVWHRDGIFPYILGVGSIFVSLALWISVGFLAYKILKTTEPVGSAKPTPPGTSAAEQPRVPGSGAG